MNWRSSAFSATIIARAKRYHAEFLAVHCQCPNEIALQRVKTRARGGTSLSETRPEFFDQQRQAKEPDPPDQHSLAVDTFPNAVEPMEKILAALQERCFDDLLVV